MNFGCVQLIETLSIMNHGYDDIWWDNRSETGKGHCHGSMMREIVSKGIAAGDMSSLWTNVWMQWLVCVWAFFDMVSDLVK